MSVTRRPLSRVQFEGIIIPVGAEVGVTEAHAALQSHTVKPGWNGMPIIGGPPDRGRKIISLTCDGTRWGPTFADLSVRDEVLLYSAVFEAAKIPAGMTSVVLRRPPVPDETKPWGYAVLAHRAGEGRIRLPLTCGGTDGRLVTLDEAQDVDVSVQFRSARRCRVVGISEPSADTVRGTQSWQLKLVDLT
ncbi:hypothetical protein [Methylorubrum sp. DB1722]|uniref:hypothetical protein n=1 Tax=Methylorubrum sp. DB1722 TaxID=2478916 RepID=UPI0018E35C08|nr:hypothetical protein [Methylorubrum sp. DB1722]MBI1689535.1 hypothetical protein [Methylorubrum sp. DB1722]